MIENANFQTMIGSSAFAQASNPQNLDGLHQATVAQAESDREEKEKDSVKGTLETRNQGVEAQQGEGGAGGGTGSGGEAKTESDQDPELEKEGDTRELDGRGQHLDLKG